MFRRDFLKSRQMLPCRFRVALALQSARQPELRGRMHGIEHQPFLERGNRIVIFLELRAEIADKVIRVGFIRCDFRHAPESNYSLFRFPAVFERQPEVIPPMGIVRQLDGRISQSRARRFQLLLPEQCHP